MRLVVQAFDGSMPCQLCGSYSHKSAEMTLTTPASDGRRHVCAECRAECEAFHLLAGGLVIELAAKETAK